MVDVADAPLVRQYLGALAEVARLVTGGQDVPETLWATISAAWADMAPDERAEVEKRARRHP